MPELCGSTTFSASKVANAASAALPPWRSISAPASAARGSAALTMPGVAVAADGPVAVAQPAQRRRATAAKRSETLAHRRAATRSRPPRQCWRSPRARAARQGRARCAGRCPALHRPSRYRAGPGSRRRGSAPRRRRRWRSRRRRSAGSAPPLAARKSRSASSASAFSGAPDRPPASPRCCDLSGGRDTVVLATISASILWSIAARTIRVGSPSLEIGRDLQEDRRAVARAPRRTAASSSSSAPSSCSSRRPGVLGELMLIGQIVARPAPSPARPPT